jgi:hypothetical protein
MGQNKATHTLDNIADVKDRGNGPGLNPLLPKSLDEMREFGIRSLPLKDELQ